MARGPLVRVLVNAASIKEGGSIVVLRNLIGGMRQLDPNNSWFIAAGNPDVDCCDSNSVTNIDAKLGNGNPVRLFYWYEIGLPAAINRWQPDVLFSMTNYLPLRDLSCPTVLLEQHAGHFSPEFAALNRSHTTSALQRLTWHYKTAWVRRSVRKTDTLFVQTRSLADRIATTGLRSRNRITVVPHGPGQVSHATERPTRSGKNGWRIGYLTKFGVQKDFETFFRAAQKVASTGQSIRLVLTLDPTYEPAAQVLRRAEGLGISHLIENHGEVRQGRIGELYDSLDVMVFCSLCESFGFPMVEAMARGVPIIVADTPENREVTGVAGLSFAPRDDGALADHLLRILTDASELKRCTELSLARGREFSWSTACKETLAVLESATGTCRDHTGVQRDRQSD